MKYEMNKTYEELMIEYWGRIVPMVDEYNKKHGTDVNPCKCISCNGTTLYEHPTFAFKPEYYKFAVAILEGKPVFVGDEVYNKETGMRLGWGYNENVFSLKDWPHKWTLTPPKHTFLLNGVKLPCPVTGITFFKLGTQEEFYFLSERERNEVSAAICDLLTAARDKK